MKSYNIDRLSKEELFGGKVIAPIRQWLKSHNIETKGMITVVIWPSLLTIFKIKIILKCANTEMKHCD